MAASPEIVPRAALSEPDPHCPLCGHAGSRAAVLQLQLEPSVELLHCDHCHGESASRVPSSEFLAALYDPAHYSSSLVSDETLSQRCARSIVDAIGFDRDRPISILDYGGSDGTLSRSLRSVLLRSGHRGDVCSTVVDLFPREDGPHQCFIDPARFEKSDETYDLLVASAVLEHLPHPLGTLRSLLAHAGTDSILYARTPYDAPLHRLVPGYRVKWPRHLHDMGPAFWDRFLTTFDVAGRLRISRPSIVETTFEQAPLRTLLAHLLKAPGHLENALRHDRTGLLRDSGVPTAPPAPRRWPLVGGWEVVIELAGAAVPPGGVGGVGGPNA